MLYQMTEHPAHTHTLSQFTKLLKVNTSVLRNEQSPEESHGFQQQQVYCSFLI